MSLGGGVALAAERIVKPVEGMHHAISRPWFRALGPLGRPVRLMHDAISGIVYTSIRGGAAAIGVSLAARVSDSSPTADTARAVVNGFWGDALGRYASLMGTEMAIRDRNGEPVRMGPAPVAALPDPTGRLVVLVHGLIKTERCWQVRDNRPGLLEALDRHPTVTPLSVRYNTGLPVAANGAHLASLIEAVRQDWPVPVESIALVGHSMGGLVTLETCAAARRADHSWIDSVTDVVTIGSPHRGAPLESLVRVAARALTITAQTRPLADFLESRSRGIKDLGPGIGGFGAEHELEAVAASPIRTHFVAGVVTSNPGNPFGALVGDLMVRPSSTTPRRLNPTNVVVLGGVHHFDLLHEPAVIERVIQWLVPLSGDERPVGDRHVVPSS